MRQTALVAASLVLVFLTGCVTPDEGAGLECSTDCPVAEPFEATLEGRIVDEELLPVAGARVTVLESRLDPTVADDAGAFRLEVRIPEINGTEALVSLRVEADRYQVYDGFVSLTRGQVNEADVTLSLLPAFVPFSDPYIFNGHYDCAAEVPIFTGDCMILYDNYVGDDPVTSEEAEFLAPVRPNWASVVAELVWTEGANNQLDGMRLYLEHPELTAEGHSVKIARVNGDAQPLRIEVFSGQAHARADADPDTGEPTQLNAQGQDVLVRVFPKGYGYSTTSQVCDQDGRCLLGVGAGLDIEFVVYVTVFYNEPHATGFSAVPQDA